MSIITGESPSRERFYSPWFANSLVEEAGPWGILPDANLREVFVRTSATTGLKAGLGSFRDNKLTLRC